MGRRRREDAAMTRERVLASAWQVIRERGAHCVTLEEVARTIGMTRGAIYGHFRSRAELFRALLTDAEAEISLRLARCDADAPGQLERLLAALLDGDALAPHANLLSAVVQHRCTEDCELCPVRAHVLQRAEYACERLRSWLPDPQRANLLVAHLWGLLSAQSLWLAPSSLAHCVAPLARLYAGADLRLASLPCASVATAGRAAVRDTP
ncbi:TetR family transcriptional regulator [Cupriavidus pinatubonensis]|nr:TetR family transcriptional regulator [Cupriavidus pinatubonensis]